MPTERTIDEQWYKMLTEGEPVPRHIYHLHGLLPSAPRCKICGSPFKGWGGFIMHLLGRDQSRYNPRFCQKCEVYEHPGGAEIVLSMLFADVRGSTRLAEKMGAREFSQLMNRFYKTASYILIQSDAMVDRLLGDEVIGLYIPGFSGPEHPIKAINAARELLRVTGHQDSNGPWLPVGVGVHTGPAYVGVVGDKDATRDFTALGDNVNVTARLASMAGPGEILITKEAYTASGLDLGNPESRELELKGKSDTINVRVFKAVHK